LTSHLPEAGPDYAPTKKTTYSSPTETKSTGWLNQSEHPDGYLSKPCPICGYKYGSEWRKVEVPADVLEFLQGLPRSDVTPAWV
jgi:hypothetical protein